MNGLATANAPDLTLPLRHMLAGVLALVLAAAALLWQGPAILAQPVGAPHALSVTHLLTLGWVTMTIMGASYQLVPVVLQVRLYSEQLAHVTFWHYLPGVAAMVAGFWLFLPPLFVAGGTAVVAGFVMYAWNIGQTLRRVGKRELHAPFFAVATAYLLAVGGYGLTLAVNVVWPFLGAGPVDHLVYHLLLGLFGWITIVAMGVAYKLGPMFALSHGRGDGFGRTVLLLAGGGLALVLIALMGHPVGAWVAIVGLVPLAGILLFVCDQWLYFRTRRRPRLDLGLRFMTFAFGYLGVTAALAWLDAAGLVRLAPAVLVTLALLGWAGNLITGQLYKIVPFLIWYERYGAKAGLERVPLLRDMFSLRWGDFNLATFVPAAALLAAGEVLHNAAAIDLGSAAALAGALALSSNLVRILRA